MARDAAVAVGIFTTGDLVAQQIEHSSAESLVPFSAERTASAAALGLIWGGGISPMGYRLSESLFPGRRPRDILKKIVLNTTLLGCIGNWSVIFGKRIMLAGANNTLTMDRIRATAQSVNADWLTVMSHDLKVWPLTDLLVFGFIPIRLRVAFVSTVSICWQSYLSYTASMGTASVMGVAAEASRQCERVAAPDARLRAPESAGGQNK